MIKQRLWSTFAYVGGMVILTMLVVGCSGNAESEPAVGATTENPPNTISPSSHDNTGDTMQRDFILPPRKGESPRVTNGIPHIQLDQTASDDMLAKLLAWAFSLDGVVEQPSRASLPGAKALTVAPELPIRAQAMIVGREFAHIHPQANGGGSLHLRLPADEAAAVVDRGWGEWHPFAVDGTMPGMVMVYAPRSDEDLKVVQTIIEAAVASAISVVDGH
jgi:phospholipase/carboxylesterase